SADTGCRLHAGASTKSASSRTTVGPAIPLIASVSYATSIYHDYVAKAASAAKHGPSAQPTPSPPERTPRSQPRKPQSAPSATASARAQAPRPVAPSPSRRPPSRSVSPPADSGDVAIGASIGGGIGIFRCHGNTTCVAQSAIAGSAAG